MEKKENKNEFYPSEAEINYLNMLLEKARGPIASVIAEKTGQPMDPSYLPQLIITKTQEAKAVFDNRPDSNLISALARTQLTPFGSQIEAFWVHPLVIAERAEDLMQYVSEEGLQDISERSGYTPRELLCERAAFEIEIDCLTFSLSEQERENIALETERIIAETYNNLAETLNARAEIIS